MYDFNWFRSLGQHLIPRGKLILEGKKTVTKLNTINSFDRILELFLGFMKTKDESWHCYGERDSS